MIYLFEFIVFLAALLACGMGVARISAFMQTLTPKVGWSHIARIASSAATRTFCKLSPSFSIKVYRITWLSLVTSRSCVPDSVGRKLTHRLCSNFIAREQTPLILSPMVSLMTTIAGWKPFFSSIWPERSCYSISPMPSSLSIQVRENTFLIESSPKTLINGSATSRFSGVIASPCLNSSSLNSSPGAYSDWPPYPPPPVKAGIT